jgi:hypothetical protein
MSTEAPHPLNKGDRALRAADHYVFVAGVGPDNKPKFFRIDADGNVVVSSSTPASENHIGQVSTPSAHVDVTFTTDTAAYASGDVIADTQPIAGAARVANAEVLLESIILIDKNKQAAAMTILFFSAATSYGAENAAPTMTAANMALNFLGSIDIATGDWKDAGEASTCTLKGAQCGILLKPATDTTTIYAAIRNGGGTPTYLADSIVGRFGFLQ